MAKTSLKVKNSRTPKFKVRAYTRCLLYTSDAADD